MYSNFVRFNIKDLTVKAAIERGEKLRSVAGVRVVKTVMLVLKLWLWFNRSYCC